MDALDVLRRRICNVTWLHTDEVGLVALARLQDVVEAAERLISTAGPRYRNRFDSTVYFVDGERLDALRAALDAAEGQA